MALDANALCTYASVKALLRLTDDTEQSNVEDAINLASSAIAEYCNRIFVLGSVTELLPARGGLRLVVQRRPLVSITSWSFDGDAQELGDLTIEDAQAGIILAREGLPVLHLASFGLSRDRLPGSEDAAISLVYQGGYVLPTSGSWDPSNALHLPRMVERAAVRTAASLFLQDKEARPDDVVSESLADYSVTYEGTNTAIGRGTAGIIPAKVAFTLESYKLHVSA